MISYVMFTQEVPVLGTSLRQAEFSGYDGWAITIQADGVTLHRPENPEQNLREVPAFLVRGVGYVMANPMGCQCHHCVAAAKAAFEERNKTSEAKASQGMPPDCAEQSASSHTEAPKSVGAMPIRKGKR